MRIPVLFKIHLVITFAVFSSVSSLSTSSQKSSTPTTSTTTTSSSTTRTDFFKHVAVVASTTTAAAAAAATVGSPLSLLVVAPQPASARGRATLEQAYDRYTPRILAGGEFYKSKLKSLIAKDDWEGIKFALQEPPKKQKSDRSKQDGGVSERAAQAGQFSDARVITALDLFAATFSDNSVSPKTKAMQKEVAELRSVVEGMKSIARQATGEESGGGGLFGIGKKQPSKSELSNKMKELYIVGGTSWNRYVFAANDGLPVALKKLPYL
jgi:hypothetical protein